MPVESFYEPVSLLLPGPVRIVSNASREFLWARILITTWSRSHCIQQELDFILMLITDAPQVRVGGESGAPVRLTVGIGTVQAPGGLASAPLHQPPTLHAVVPRAMPTTSRNCVLT
jgi:hypothetical protein